jgi:hypothetical protein
VILFVHSNQFIVQELAPFPIFGGLLARHGACLSALLYKSIPYRFDDANVEQDFWFLQILFRENFGEG